MNPISRVLPLAMLVLSPLALSAQACLGVPTGTNTAIIGGLSFPSNATGFTASGVMGAGESLYADASVGVIAPDIEGAENITHFGVGAAYEMPNLLETASVCPSASIGYQTVGGMNAFSIPLGVGIGTTMPMAEDGSTTLTPYVTPAFVWSRVTMDGVDGSASDTYFALNGGATIGFGQILAGAFLSKAFQDGADAVFGLQAGFAF